MNIPQNIPKNILITGASSGLGAALAIAYAHSESRLYLFGRNEERLEAVAESCRERGAHVKCYAIDVCDAEAMAEALLQIDGANPLDIVIANAGISGGTGAMSGESVNQANQIFNVNINGVLNTLHPLIEPMQKRGRGQLAIMSSVASFSHFPSAPAYAASKAAVRFYGEGLRGVLKPHGVSVSVICPGFIKTPMTDVNNFPMPFIMSPEKAAHKIVTALATKRGRIAFPLALYIPLYLVSCLSPRLTDWAFSKLPEKSNG